MLSLTSDALILVLLLTFPYNNVYGNEQQDSCSRSCGVHNISHPFRLKDSHENCGDRSHRGNNNISCMDIRRMMFYGFELSWLNSFCKVSDRLQYAELDQYNKPRCVHPGMTKSRFRKMVAATFIRLIVVLLSSAKLVLGALCIITKPNDRPSMDKVLEMLEEEDGDLQIPNKPYFYPQDQPVADVGDDDISSSWSSYGTSVSDPREPT
ncbi:hypothetical protein P8452_01030 [Trifolium repens]|nr:hypothetical protein P8452_01030 [Trifolium repens]